MKTAVSLPDELFQLAESRAKQLSISRSQLYATAIAEYLRHTRSESVTARLDEIYATEPSRLDPAFRRAQAKSLPKDSW